ncbi:MAG: hypothetical protein Q9215_002043, partial [Flavoplaca cf. flavocitrina]
MAGMGWGMECEYECQDDDDDATPTPPVTLHYHKTIHQPQPSKPMASLLFAGGVLAYEKIKDAKAKKAFRKAHNEARYSDLQSSTCTCVPSSGIEKEGEERDVKG